MTYILFNGDSWSNENYTPSKRELEAGIPKLDLKFYTEQLSDKLQKERVNLAISGNSNGRIVFDTLEYLFNNPKPDLVVVQLSSFVRFSYKGWKNGDTAGFQHLAMKEEYDKFNKTQTHTLIGGDNNAWTDHRLPLSNIAIHDFLTTDMILDQELLYVLSLIKYLEEMNIKYIIFFGIYLWHKNNDGIPNIFNKNFKDPTIFRYAPNFLHKYINNKYFKEIDDKYTNNFFGWPGDEYIGGLNFYELRKHFPNSNTYCYYYNKPMGLIDSHPNQKYHDLITEKIYEFIKEKYKTI